MSQILWKNDYLAMLKLRIQHDDFHSSIGSSLSTQVLSFIWVSSFSDERLVQVVTSLSIQATQIFLKVFTLHSWTDSNYTGVLIQKTHHEMR